MRSVKKTSLWRFLIVLGLLFGTAGNDCDIDIDGDGDLGDAFEDFFDDLEDIF